MCLFVPAFGLAKGRAHFLTSPCGFAIDAVFARADSGASGPPVRLRHSGFVCSGRQMGQTEPRETSRSSQKHSLRMRHVADWRREHPLLGEILSRRDAVHSLRYRSCFPVSVGGGLQGDAEGEREFDFRRDGFVPWGLVRRLSLRPEERGLRLEKLRPCKNVEALRTTSDLLLLLFSLLTLSTTKP